MDFLEHFKSIFIDKVPSYRLETAVFTIHYKLSVFVVSACGLLVSSKKYFGDSIDCGKESNQFCWINSYLVVKTGADKHDVSFYDPVFNCPNCTLDNVKDDPNLEAYYPTTFYQWIEVVLFLQAFLFFIPYYLWAHVWEKNIIQDSIEFINDKDSKRASRFPSRSSRFAYCYAFKYTCCELLNTLNITLQFIVLSFSLIHVRWGMIWDDFLESRSVNDKFRPLDMKFPTLTRCDIKNMTGDITARVICVLSINLFAKKIVSFLWFYLFAIFIVTWIGTIYRVSTCISKSVRVLAMKRSGFSNKHTIELSSKDATYGDWLFLHLIAKNISPSLLDEYVDMYLELGWDEKTNKSDDKGTVVTLSSITEILDSEHVDFKDNV